jgi:hypothetical protein
MKSIDHISDYFPRIGRDNSAIGFAPVVPVAIGSGIRGICGSN